ncbi:hypothetical protein HDU87_002582 [Geranomyces variabilis]|uniref:chitin synthase n=1 Tax=Geranomyces variabilis TaxID=109894 RepID=A0AAD5XR69_9FUNG|nr:hypothetical protein HDU87_002582 [Geranomyces variabilis]
MRRQTDPSADEIDALVMQDTHSEAGSVHSSPPEYPDPGPMMDPRLASHFSFSRPTADSREGQRHVTIHPPPDSAARGGAAIGSEAYNHAADLFPSRSRRPDAEVGVGGPLSRRRSNAAGVRRQNTLSKPERHRSTRRALMRAPSMGPPPARVGATPGAATVLPSRASYGAGAGLGGRGRGPYDAKPNQQQQQQQAMLDAADDSNESKIWMWSARIMTCCFLPFCLRAGGMREKLVQQAWREKVALCMIIVVLCGGVVFLTVGLQRVLCPDSGFQENISMFDSKTGVYIPGSVGGILIDGFQYDFDQVKSRLAKKGFKIEDDRRGTDISLLFVKRDPACAGYYPGATAGKCDFPDLAGISATSACADLSLLNSVAKSKRFMDWTDMPRHTQPPHVLTVFNGGALNLTDYLASPQARAQPAVTAALTSALGQDGTYRFARTDSTRTAVDCLSQGYRVGWVGEERNGCIAAQVIQTIALVVIVGVVMSKFFMAVWFHWFGLPSSKIDPVPRMDKRLSRVSARYSMSRANHRQSIYGYTLPQTNDLHTILLVTCYSEGKQGIQSTLDSLAGSDYPDAKKLLFVVADGMITGHGEEMSTPDIIVSMMELDPQNENPKPKSYIAIAHGEKQHNMAKVYSGWYIVGNRRVPMITVVKCGSPLEANHPKPGNRGKRDSQLVIMNFLSRTLFNDRMTELDYELFSRIQAIATTADKYEAILMVDADTKVAPDALRHMVNTMRSDVTIMGLCGETRIANKTASLTSAIQVFEYYISHHLGKAFESVFGGVTCLPGCFCMYRIKAPKGDSGLTVPVLTNPNIVEEYSENIVDTLHKKNLLLLGEDRFLTTLMLRNFPHRKMVFVPSAVCWTIVPDQFKVLLSQRRRWINSTVHNLLELVLVRDLCGTFCFSMQFVVMLELIGTVVLPAAICLTLYLIISAIIYHTADLIPFLMLAAILGLPGVLIAITTRKMIYVLWMLVYLVSLPIWNFVLPVYAFWHFDDFTWGETRKVEGETREQAHGDQQGRFESRAVIMKKWAEWERDRQGVTTDDPTGTETKRRTDYAKRQSRIQSIHATFGVPLGPDGLPDYGPRRQSMMPNGRPAAGIILPPPTSARGNWASSSTSAAAVAPAAGPYYTTGQQQPQQRQNQTQQRDSYFPPLLMGGLQRNGGGGAAPIMYPAITSATTTATSANSANNHIIDTSAFPSPGGIFEQGPPARNIQQQQHQQRSLYEMQPLDSARRQDPPPF